MQFALAGDMPYATNEELPPTVRAHLPEHALDIYREAFNHAYDRYPHTDEGRIHRIAWAAVKRVYEKIAGQWVRRDVWRHP